LAEPDHAGVRHTSNPMSRNSARSICTGAGGEIATICRVEHELGRVLSATIERMLPPSAPMQHHYDGSTEPFFARAEPLASLSFKSSMIFCRS